MRRLKIAFVVDRFGSRWGGAESYGEALMRELAPRHDITVFARDYDKSSAVQLPYVAFKTRQWWPSWLRVWQHAKQAKRLTQHGFDIVHSHNNGWAGNVEVVHVTPVRYRWRCRPMPWFKRVSSWFSLRVGTYLWLERQRVNAPRASDHKVVAVSALIADQLQQAYGDQHLFPVIPPGVDWPALDKTNRLRVKQRQSLGLQPNDWALILVARNPVRKGLSTIMAALASLPATFELLVVGCDEASKKVVHQHHAFASLQARIRLIPPIADPHPYYLAADVCVHPTRNDSFGMAPLEAMAHGLPAIVSPMPWCGFAGQLSHLQNAWLLDSPDDVAGLTKALRRLHDNVQLREKVISGGEKVVALHQWPIIAQQYERLYQAIVASSDPVP